MALYRVARVSYEYQTGDGLDDARDWRVEEARHRAADPMHATAAPMVASNASALVPNRVVNLEYSHDWLANMTEWTDDAHVFSEDLARDNPNGDRVRALFRAWRQRKLGDA